MDSIYLLIPIALVFVALGIWIFFWAVDSGQFDDLDSPAHSILFDDEPHTSNQKSESHADTLNENSHPSQSDPN